MKTREELNLAVENAKRMTELMSNEHFNHLVMNGYVAGGILGYGQSISRLNEGDVKICIAEITARSNFKRFVDDTLQAGRDAILEIDEMDKKDASGEEVNPYGA